MLCFLNYCNITGASSEVLETIPTGHLKKILRHVGNCGKCVDVRTFTLFKVFITNDIPLMYDAQLSVFHCILCFYRYFTLHSS